jgi:hypothetical protein
VVAHGDTTEDRWHVLSHTVDEDERLRVQRAWLRGARSARTAVVLQFAPAGAQFADSFAGGRAFDGTLAFWPGALPRRALVQRREEQDHAAGPLAGATSIARFLSDQAAALARMPWIENDVALLGSIVPVPDGERFAIADTSGDGLSLVGREHGLLFALSGGHPIDLVGEWDGRRLRPLSAVAEGRFHQLAGRFDG